MSGIAGIYYKNDCTADPEMMVLMLECLACRGPDGINMWSDGPVSLGHRMLWTTPESLSECLPLIGAGGRLVLTADARIDNRDELISVLGLSTPRPEEITDSQLILAAYERWGKACLTKLVGDFAFAIWDDIEKQVFCARDPMGVKPFYYYASHQVFVFASQINALFCLPNVPRTINESRIAEHLALVFENQGKTFYQDIYQLPAAHGLTIGSEGAQLHRYWDLDPRVGISYPSDEAYVEAFLEVFAESVRCRLRSAYPVASMLSGGLDSSSIVTMARKLLTDGRSSRLKTFSAIFPCLSETYPKIDERQWIEAVVAQGGLESYYIHADELSPLEALAITEDEPLPVPNMWLDWGCFRAAHEVGVRVILSGYDGDTVLSYGDGLLAELARSFQWLAFLNEARAISQRKNVRFLDVIKDQAIRPNLPPQIRRAWRRLRRWTPPPVFTFSQAIDPEFARRTGVTARVTAMCKDEPQPYRTPRELHKRALMSSMLLYGADLMDKVGAYWAMEARMPFFDRRLIEFVLALPVDQKMRKGWNRYVMRKAMQGLLPREVQWREGKGNLSPNIRRGLCEERQELDRMIQQDAHIIAEYVDLTILRDVYQKFLRKPMQSTDPEIFTLLTALTLAQWLIKSGAREAGRANG